MITYINIFFLSIFFTYFTMYREIISGRGETIAYIIIYFLIYLLVYTFIYRAYEYQHKKLLPKNYLIIFSSILFLVSLFMLNYTIIQDQKINDDFDGNNKEISIEEQSDTFIENVSNLKKKIILFY